MLKVQTQAAGLGGGKHLLHKEQSRFPGGSSGNYSRKMVMISTKSLHFPNAALCLWIRWYIYGPILFRACGILQSCCKPRSSSTKTIPLSCAVEPVVQMTRGSMCTPVTHPAHTGASKLSVGVVLRRKGMGCGPNRVWEREDLSCSSEGQGPILHLKGD